MPGRAAAAVPRRGRGPALVAGDIQLLGQRGHAVTPRHWTLVVLCNTHLLFSWSMSVSMSQYESYNNRMLIIMTQAQDEDPFLSNYSHRVPVSMYDSCPEIV